MRPPFRFLFPLLLAPAFVTGPAHAAVFCSAVNFATCSLTENGVTISDFSFTDYTPQAGDQFRLRGDISLDRAGDIQLEFNPGLRGTGGSFLGTRTGSFSYKITLAPTDLNTFQFNAVNVQADGNTTAGGNIQTEVTAAGLSPNPKFSRTGGGSTSNQGTFSSSISSRTFTQSFTLDPLTFSATRLDSVIATWDTRTSPVPGPLPLLGAVTAFGLSRKLRSRIRSAA